MRCFCLALRVKQQQPDMPTCEAWGCALTQAAGDNSELGDILGVFTSMLVGEPRASATFRWTGNSTDHAFLMLCGLPASRRWWMVSRWRSCIGMGGQLQIFGRRFTFQSDLSCKPYDCDFDFVVLVFAPKIAQRGAAPVC